MYDEARRNVTTATKSRPTRVVTIASRRDAAMRLSGRVLRAVMTETITLGMRARRVARWLAAGTVFGDKISSQTQRVMKRAMTATRWIRMPASIGARWLGAVTESPKEA